jgi:hypothetical protein
MGECELGGDRDWKGDKPPPPLPLTLTNSIPFFVDKIPCYVGQDILILILMREKEKRLGRQGGIKETWGACM